MTHSMMEERTEAEQRLKERYAKIEMRQQVWMFTFTILLTLFSFGTVIAYQQEIEGFSRYFVLPVIFLLGAVQVGVQLYYFMHLKEKGHGIPQYFLYMGMIFGALLPLAMLTIVWW
ncbi:cytochrome B6 [Planococcaceae bacterium Storch 2/2-2]|nr:cytochrome B6 [Planococcaceae bacterium Storch 2/2-2]